MNDQQQRFNSFSEFYPYYLSEHKHPTCRRLHVLGSVSVLLVLAYVLMTQYWVGHFFFEHNKPATFKYPLYSFVGDWVMFWQVISGKIKF